MRLFVSAHRLVGVGLVAALILSGCTRSEDTAQSFDPAQFPLFELTAPVRGIFEGPGPAAEMAYDYLRYANALVNDVDALDATVAPDVLLHELEGSGLTGLAGLKEFRRRRNDMFAYDRAVVLAMRFPEQQIIEVDLCTERTDTTSGARRTIIIYARNRWVDHKLVERWDRAEEQPAGADCGPR